MQNQIWARKHPILSQIFLFSHICSLINQKVSIFHDVIELNPQITYFYIFIQEYYFFQITTRGYANIFRKKL